MDNIWCLLIPLIVGLLCALLGYLLGNNKDEINVWKQKVANLEADLEACNKSKLDIKAKGDNLAIWKDKVTKLEADLKLANDANANLKTSGSSDLDLWKNKVTKLEADLAACNASKLSLRTDLTTANNSLASSLAAAATVNLIPFDADAAKAVFGKKIKQDDLKVVEGIGPKIEGLFHNFDIKTWKALSEASVEKCQEVLDSGGERYKIHNPGTWPKQAELAYQGKWAELLKWQDELDGGKA